MTDSRPDPTRSGPLPPGLLLCQLGIGRYLSRALGLAARVGIADRLAGERELDPAALRRVLRLLASVGLCEERPDGDFALTETGELLRSDHPDSMRSAVQLFAGPGIPDSWKQLEYCVRTGRPAFTLEVRTRTPSRQMNADPAQAALFVPGSGWSGSCRPPRGPACSRPDPPDPWLSGGPGIRVGSGVRGGEPPCPTPTAPSTMPTPTSWRRPTGSTPSRTRGRGRSCRTA